MIDHANDNKFKNVQKAFKDIILSDVNKAITVGANYIAFIALCCLIDTAATYFAGNKDSRGDNYEEFILKYMAKYNGLFLWNDLRNKIVHACSIGRSIVIGNNNDNKLKKLTNLDHIRNGSHTQTIIVIEDFRDDVRNAIEKYLNDLRFENVAVNPYIWSNFVDMYDMDGSLGTGSIQTSVNNITMHMTDSRLTCMV